MVTKADAEDASDVESEPESGFSVSEVSSDVQSVDSDDTKQEVDDHNQGSDDSSEDERPARNTVGEIPLEWYKDEEHIGYDREGQKIAKQKRRDRLDALLARNDSSKDWRAIYDEYNDEEIVLSKEELKMLKRIRDGQFPDVEIDPYEPENDWFSRHPAQHPIISAPTPKSSFIPSKSEAKKVVKLVRALRMGWLKPPTDKPRDEDGEEEEEPAYMMWQDDGLASDKTAIGLSYIPAPKPQLPGHEESYHPPQEYLPTEEERQAWELLDPEDRPAQLPSSYNSLREVPGYASFIKERFERCLDLYLCPRTRRRRPLVKDPESLVPQLPSPKDLRPFPTTLMLRYLGHTGSVLSIAPDPTGQWLASAAAGHSVFILPSGTGTEEVEAAAAQALSQVPSGDYFASVAPTGNTQAILVHQLSRQLTQNPFRKNKGRVVKVEFHPSKPFFFVATHNHVRVYNLVKQQLAKKLVAGSGIITALAIHPSGDHIIVGTEDKRLAWFDMDLSTKPYRIMRYHTSALTGISFHRTYPLFASSSTDASAHVFHGMVYQDLMTNPLIVPVKVLRDFQQSRQGGACDCKFHPTQPWIFVGGADGVTYLFGDQ
ncbi:hypothetical protein WJX73_008137 [Symbiochloris irregularis]|uniref:Ribosome biogenesis protein BOP1 homolog n=1 Tax=Symbiochloris irregularis TaxID=706552 RepID=A0AAW1NRB0_9CHLO